MYDSSTTISCVDVLEIDRIVKEAVTITSKPRLNQVRCSQTSYNHNQRVTDRRTTEFRDDEERSSTSGRQLSY